MALLSKQQILEAQDIKTTTVAVPEWGGEVIVGTMTAAERDQFEMEALKMRKSNGGELPTTTSIRARLAAWTLVDEQGNRVFTETEVLALSQKSGVALDRIFDAATSLNGLSGAEKEKTKGE